MVAIPLQKPAKCALTAAAITAKQKGGALAEDRMEQQSRGGPRRRGHQDDAGLPAKFHWHREGSTGADQNPC
jgi:hypothetical protein